MQCHSGAWRSSLIVQDEVASAAVFARALAYEVQRTSLMHQLKIKKNRPARDTRKTWYRKSRMRTHRGNCEAENSADTVTRAAVTRAGPIGGGQNVPLELRQERLPGEEGGRLPTAAAGDATGSTGDKF